MAAVAASAAAAATERVAVVHSATAAEQLQQRGCCGGRSAAVVRSATVAAWLQERGCCGGGGSATAQRWRQLGGGTAGVAALQRQRRNQSAAKRTVRWRQRGGSSAEAAADSLAPSANGPTQVPSNATDSPTYASLSLVEDGGMTASTASLSLP
jgi:hypothetical protein